MKSFISGMLENFNTFRNGIDNWFSVALNMFIFKRASVCKIRNIGSVKLKKGKNYLNSSLFRALVFSNSKNLSDDQIDLLKDYIPQLNNDIITVVNREDKKRFKFLNREMSLIFESFIYGDYSHIPYSENGSVIDVGANVADTAIYFANKGYNVYAFEPLPHICEIAKKNIDLNPNVKDKIVFVNKACSCKNGVITINFNKEDTGGANEFMDADDSVDVEAITIGNIIKEYNVKPDILKIDCEGCEANIIKHSDLSMFNQIIMEYHTNVTGVDENTLIDLLKNQGFKLKSQIKFIVVCKFNFNFFNMMKKLFGIQLFH